MKKAIFLDRDGVINDEIYQKNLNEFTAPLNPKQVKIEKKNLVSLKRISNEDFLLFVISNQPDYALGRTTKKNLRMVHKKIKKILKNNSIFIKEFFYSFKHPKSKKKNYGKPCFDRKPNPYFLLKAKKKYNLDISNSWMIGDRPTDTQCGRNAGAKTIGVKNKNFLYKRKDYNPTYFSKNLSEALNYILKK